MFTIYSMSAILQRSCRDILRVAPSSPTGVYSVTTSTGTSRNVFCKMEDGGYTFLHPDDYSELSPSDQDYIVTNKQSVMFYLQLKSGEMKFGILNQLSAFQKYPLKIEFNSDAYYVIQWNPNLHVEFVPPD